MRGKKMFFLKLSGPRPSEVFFNGTRAAPFFISVFVLNGNDVVVALSMSAQLKRHSCDEE